MQASFSGRGRAHQTIGRRGDRPSLGSVARSSSINTPSKLVIRGNKKDVKFISFKEGVCTVAGRLELEGIKPEVVKSILYDYSNRAASIWSNVEESSSKRVESQGASDSVQTFQVAQTCSWRFAIFSGQFLCRILVEQRRDDSDLPQLKFKLVESSFMRDFEGEWRISQAENGVIVDHLLSVKPMIDIPESLSSLSQGIFCAQVQQTLNDLEKALVN